LQRLFSTFADGWPGVGLLLQRILIAILLVRLCIIGIAGAAFSPAMIPHIIAGSAAILLLIGLWTPIVGALIVIIELWLAITQMSDPWVPIIVGTLAATVAMIGPGEWSIDARLFGRRHVKT
jgi:putative oxidoreductase